MAERTPKIRGILGRNEVGQLENLETMDLKEDETVALLPVRNGVLMVVGVIRDEDWPVVEKEIERLNS